MNQTAANLPGYLRKYVSTQPQDKYSARDHAVWRFIMRQSRAYFADHAVAVYGEGLKKTGVTLDHIPRIEDMDAHLREIGWGAIPVTGFIPPAAFLDFQARRILPIACDMRTIEHIHYTPAPDIVHEAAGHAPILADTDYSAYLTKYAAMAQKAIFAREDLDLYEAIRTLSDVKENPDSTPVLIEHAEQRLAAAGKALKFASEANRTARMNWWTVEYGLVGTLADPKIYGAGLLSSVGESQACLSAKVRKIPLSIACVEQSYDITEPQPQLFVAESLAHMVEVLDEFEATLSFRRGGRYGLEQAEKGRTVTTTVLDSGAEISGKLSEFLAEGEQVDFVRYEGPVQLAFAEKELPGQGRSQHETGFSSPLGRFRPLVERLPHTLTDDELSQIGIAPSQTAALELTSGFLIKGKVIELCRQGGDLILIKWRQCTVSRQGKVYFQPEWGDFDMTVGTEVVSVYGGPADREAYGTHDVGNSTTTPGRTSPYSAEELSLFAVYEEVRSLRKGLSEARGPMGSERIGEIQALADKSLLWPDAWLLRLETLELCKMASDQTLAARAQGLQDRLLTEADRFETEVCRLIKKGIEHAAVPD